MVNKPLIDNALFLGVVGGGQGGGGTRIVFCFNLLETSHADFSIIAGFQVLYLPFPLTFSFFTPDVAESASATSDFLTACFWM